MNKTGKSIVVAAVALVAVHANAFEYTVTRPTFRPRWSGAEPGEWTMDRETAFAKAKADVSYTIVMFTGSWWCPICQTFEAKVLKSQAWADYIAKMGCYLVGCDYPYRFPVPAGQEWKGTSPLGDGWGFQCWLYDAEYLAENGLTAEDGLAKIQEMYDYQDSLALPDSTTDTISRYGGGTMELHKIAYPSLVLFRPDGSEVGRVTFPRAWYLESAVSDEDAINYIIGGLEALRGENGGGLYDNPTAGGFIGTAASQYLGWIADGETGEVAGTVSVKAAKANKKTGLSKLTATVEPRGGVKVVLTGTAEAPSTNKVFLLKKAGSTASASVKLGANGIVGYYVAPNGKSYSIQGGRNIFPAKDADAKARAATLAKGFWPIAFKTADNGGSAFANGYSGFSASVGLNGKTKVVGTLGNGVRVSLLSQAIVGENGKAVVPVSDKKGAFSFMLEFQGGQLTGVSGVAPWKSSARPAQFTATWNPAVFSAAAGVGGAVPDIMYLQIGGFDPAAGIGGKAIAVSPADDAIIKKGNKWTGTKAVSDLTVTFKPQAGTFSGSFNFYVNDGAPKPKKLKATVSGVVVDGVPQGTAVIKGIGSLPVKFAGSCGGGC